jgi:hypothetical protein
MHVSYLDHILVTSVIILTHDTTACTGLNVKLRSQLLVSSNRIVQSTFHEFCITALKVTILGRNMLPE